MVQESELREKFHQYRPKELLSSENCYGTGQFWTVGDVKAVLEKCYGVSYRYRGSYRNLPHRCGFSYQKGE